MSNSPLVTYTKIAPPSNHYGKRTHAIDTITIHCYVGQVTVERAGKGFANPERGASCNYVVGYDGRIGLILPEEYASGCSDSPSNDQRAITIEVACDKFHPYAVTGEAYGSLIELLTDICRRNPGIGRLRWKGNKSLVGKVAQQNMTVHRWFARKACPGDYLYKRHGQIAQEVNRRLDAAEKEEKNAMDKQTQANHVLPVPDNTPADWEKEAVDWAVKNGLMVGDGTGNLMLHSSITRAQFCVMLKRYHDKSGNIA